MLRAVSLVRSRLWREGDAIACVTLPFTERHRRRIRMTDDQGRDFLLDLADTQRIEDGDGLVLETGGVILVRAAEEDVLDIRCRDTTETARIAWHLGNRHTPVQVLDDGVLRIAYDHVLAHMVEALGAHTRRTRAAFAPEGGAYFDTGSNAGHLHGEDHGHHH